MRKGLLVFIITIFLCALFVSCGLDTVDENSSINHYIFPYVKFTLSDDGTYYSASILKGASVANVYIPGYVNYNDVSSLPVKFFTGFESHDDIVNLKNTTFESSTTVIKLKSLDQASILETIDYKTVESSTAVWKNLPEFSHTSTEEFVGWFTTDTNQEVHNGDVMDPEHSKIYAKYIEITLTHHEEVEPTCTEAGNIEYWQCSNCGLLFADSQCSSQITQVTIPALGHATLYVEEKEATCTKDGVQAHYECSRCHALFEDKEATKPTTLAGLTTDARGHNWVYKCGEKISDGHWKECTRCQETKDAEPHNFSKEEVTKEPTHESVGTMTYTCEECGATKTEDIAPIGDHIWVKTDTVILPTCEEQGYTVYKCTVSGCSATYKGDYVDPLGHTIKTTVEAKEPTCTKDGNKKYYICSVCENLFWDQNGKNKIASIDETIIEALGHLFNEEVFEKDATHHWHKCTREGCDAITEKVSHDYKEKTTTYLATEANCTEAATYYYTCACGLKGTETFEYGNPDGHKGVEHKRREADCGNNGNIAYWECSVCSKKFYDSECTREIDDGDEIIPATGNHSFEYYVSFGENGHKKHCYVCNKEYGDYLSHNIDTLNWKDNSTHHWHECGDCGYKIDYKEHTYEKYGSDEVCGVCKHLKAEKEDTTDGGFDIKPETLEPTGKLTVEGSNGSFKAIFTLDENSKMTSVVWYLEEEIIEGETLEKSSTCSFSAPDRRTYHITCVVFNGTLVSSFEQTVIGGASYNV